MAALSTVLALLASTSLARPSNERVWSSASWVMHGDHTPQVLSFSPKLTATGANQMRNQGAAFRNRYLQPGDDYVGIFGIQTESIDNSQLNIESSTDECSAASAMIFMEGLYPHPPDTSCDLDVKLGANRTMEDFALCGAQHPNIRTIAAGYDPDSIWSRGYDSCNKHQQSVLMFPGSFEADAIHQSSRKFYLGLWDSLFCDAFPLSEANFYNAHELYEYAAYRWNYDDKARSAMTSDDLEKLQRLAWQEQQLKHANMAGSGAEKDDKTSAIAGRTLASRVAALFSQHIESCSERNKLNVAFTSHEPFLAFFALAGLDAGNSSQPFSRLPEPGATMTFELFSPDSEDADSFDHPNSYDTSARAYRHRSRRGYDKGSTGSSGGNPITRWYNTLRINQVPVGSTSGYRHDTSCPSPNNLYVRFFYRTSASDSCTPVSLFGSNHSSMSFKQFSDIMGKIGIADAAQWCGVCESDAFFCQGAEPRKTNYLLWCVAAGSVGLAVIAVIVSLF